MTITERVLAAPGALVDCALDVLVANDIGAPICIKEFEKVLELNPTTGEIKNRAREETHQAQPLPPFAQDIMAAEGWMRYVAKQERLPGR